MKHTYDIEKIWVYCSYKLDSSKNLSHQFINCNFEILFRKVLQKILIKTIYTIPPDIIMQATYNFFSDKIVYRFTVFFESVRG